MSTITARALINLALRQLGVLGAAMTNDTDTEAEYLVLLNNLIESWSLENLMILAATEETETLTSGKASYTIGASGDFNTTRPLRFRDQCFIRSGGIDYPIDLRTMDVYRAEPNKGTTGRPFYFAYQPNYVSGTAQGTVYFYFTPDSSTDVFHLMVVNPINTFNDIATETIDFEPGFERALVHNAAIEFAPYANVEMDGRKYRSLIVSAREAKKTIKAYNARLPRPFRFDGLARMTRART